MPTLREEHDADRQDDRGEVSGQRTEHNTHEVSCSICNRTLYVDDAMLEKINRAVQTGLENPLICEVCIQEGEELSHQKL